MSGDFERPGRPKDAQGEAYLEQSELFQQMFSEVENREIVAEKIVRAFPEQSKLVLDAFSDGRLDEHELHLALSHPLALSGILEVLDRLPDEATLSSEEYDLQLEQVVGDSIFHQIKMVVEQCQKEGLETISREGITEVDLAKLVEAEEKGLAGTYSLAWDMVDAVCYSNLVRRLDILKLKDD